MKKIYLTRGKCAIVDDEDFDFLNQWKWSCAVDGYAFRNIKKSDGKRTIVYMHRIINKTPEGYETDHINRNKLDNRKSNLRTVDRKGNSINHGLQINNTSGHRGIHWQANAWVARIKVDSKEIYLGRFKNLQEAVLIRKKAELIHHII